MKQKIIVNEVICPHCDSELQIKLMKNEAGEIEHKVSVTDPGKKIVDEQKENKKESGNVDSDFWGE